MENASVSLVQVRGNFIAEEPVVENLSQSNNNSESFTVSEHGDSNHEIVPEQNTRNEPVMQSDARPVRMQNRGILLRSSRYCILVFSFLCILAPTKFAIMVWMILEYFSHMQVKCDVPLHTWVEVVCLVAVFNLTLNRPSARGSFMQRVVCWWRPDPEDPRLSGPTPLRVRVYNCAVTLFTFVWNCLGIYWIIVDGHGGGTPCSNTASGLYMSVQFYAAINVVLICFAPLLRLAMRRGLLRFALVGVSDTNNPAPPGALEKNTNVVTNMSSESLEEQPQCSICLEEFTFGPDTEQILKTKGCDHFFHSQCLQGWLNVNRVCPLCRHDLGGLTEP